MAILGEVRTFRLVASLLTRKRSGRRTVQHQFALRGLASSGAPSVPLNSPAPSEMSESPSRAKRREASLLARCDLRPQRGLRLGRRRVRPSQRPCYRSTARETRRCGASGYRAALHGGVCVLNTVIRILLHSRAFYPSLGGVEQATLLLARELTKRGVSVTVATDVAADPAEDARLGFRVLRQQSIPTLARFARTTDLVHASGFSMRSFEIAVAARRPVIFTHHGYQATCLVGLGWHDGERCDYRLRTCSRLTSRQRGITYATRQLARHVLSRYAVHAAAAHVSVSAFVNRVIAAPRSSVIHNGVDTDIFFPAPSARAERLLFVGRFVQEKGVEELLTALFTCSRGGTPVALDVVGAGPLENRYRQRVHDLGLTKFVTFRGRLNGSDLAAAIRGCTAVVVPSTWDEAFGIVAAEAIACGRVPLVSSVGGLPELVGDMDCVAAAGDHHAWARLLVQAARDSQWRARNEARLPALAARFTPEAFATAYCRVYERVLS